MTRTTLSRSFRVTLPRTFSSPGADAPAAAWLNPIRETLHSRPAETVAGAPVVRFAHTPSPRSGPRMKRWGDVSQDEADPSRGRVRPRPRRDGGGRDRPFQQSPLLEPVRREAVRQRPAKSARDAWCCPSGIMEKDHPLADRARQARAQGRRVGGHGRRQARRRHDRLRPGPGRAAASPVGLGDRASSSPPARRCAATSARRTASACWSASASGSPALSTSRRRSSGSPRCSSRSSPTTASSS